MDNQKLYSGDVLDTLDPKGIRSIWCKYLRSGQFVPSIGKIRDGDKYDAFGVLCLVMADLGLDCMTDEEWDQLMPPHRIMKQAGLSCAKERKTNCAKGGDAEIIATLIDYGATFEVIASLFDDPKIQNGLRRICSRQRQAAKALPRKVPK